MTSELADRSAEVRGRNSTPLLKQCLYVSFPGPHGDVVHWKYKQKVVTDCSARLELAVLQHDKQKSAVTEEERNKEKEVSGVWIGMVSVWEGAGTC